MKKILITFAVLILFVFLVMPYVTGRVAESVTRQVAMQVNANPSEYGELQFQQYDRGIRSSAVKFSWSPANSIAALNGEAVSYECDASHGMLRYRYACRAENLGGYTQFVNEKLGGDDPLTIGGEVSVFGNIKQHFTLDAFELVEDDGAKLTVQPGKLTISTDQELSEFSVDGELIGLQITHEGELIKVGDVALQGDLQTNDYDLLVGEFGLEADAFAISEAEGSGKAQGLLLRGSSKEQGDNLQLDYRLSAESMVSVTASQGEIQVKEPTLTMQVAGIDMRQLSELLQQLKLVASASGEVSNAVKLAVVPKLEALLKAGLHSGFNVSAEVDGDDFETDFSLLLVDKLSLGDFVLLAVNPTAVLSKAEVEFDSRLPKSMIGDDPQKHAGLLGRRWYIEKGQSYVANFRLKDGQMTLNGKAISIEELMTMNPAK